VQINKRSRILPRGRYLYRDGRMGGRLSPSGESLPGAPFEAALPERAAAQPAASGLRMRRFDPAAPLATTGS